MKKFTLILTAALLCTTVLAGCKETKEDSNMTDEVTTAGETLPETEPQPQWLPAPALDREKVDSHAVISLWPEDNIPYQREDSKLAATIQAYLVEGADKSVVIFPGGGYFQLSVDSEGTQIAKAYNELGYNAFVACYRYKPYDGSATLADGQRAVQWVRFYADQLGVNPDKIAVCGFSAGGHLSVMVAQHAPEENLVGDEIGGVSSAPNACVLAYPVVTLGDGTYPTMPEIFAGNDPDLIKKYSYDYNMPAMPASFVFTSKRDSLVDYTKNSAVIAAALEAQGTPVEYKEYADGEHGIGLGKGHKQYSAWVADSVAFLDQHL